MFSKSIMNHNPKLMWLYSTKILMKGRLFQAQLLICLYHTFRLLRREITCEKMGFASAKPAHCLERLQSIAFSKLEVENNKNLIQLKNTKIKSVVDYCEEKWFKVKEQWVTYFKN